MCLIPRRPTSECPCSKTGLTEFAGFAGLLVWWVVEDDTVYRRILLRKYRFAGTKQNKTVQKEMAVLTKTEELLTNALTDEPK